MAQSNGPECGIMEMRRTYGGAVLKEVRVQVVIDRIAVSVMWRQSGEFIFVSHRSFIIVIVYVIAGVAARHRSFKCLTAKGTSRQYLSSLGGRIVGIVVGGIRRAFH